MPHAKQDTAGWRLENTYRELPALFYQEIAPQPVAAPELVILNEPLAASLGLSADWLASIRGVETLAGNRLAPGSRPLAQAYAGHQFGFFTLLGDGRAHVLGEQITPAGQRFDIQLKGSGRTAYSRAGDGRATLGPMLREYLVSEALSALGIPTTQSLAVVRSGEGVQRRRLEPGAVLTRVAPSHLRVGTFQLARALKEPQLLTALFQYAAARDQEREAIHQAANPALFFLETVIRRQAALIAGWQQVGLIHGVMNTDNVSIAGVSMDFGPLAFLDVYDLATVFSSIDADGRYAFGRQPEMGLWNLSRLAEALLPLLSPDEGEALTLAQQALAGYEPLYRAHYQVGMKKKLGLPEEPSAQDRPLIEDFLTFLQDREQDYTNAFLDLTYDELQAEVYQSEAFLAWRKRRQRLLDAAGQTAPETRAIMRAANPALILRNAWLEEALVAAEDRELEPFLKLLTLLRQPFLHSPAQRQKRRDYAVSRPGDYRTFCGT